MLSLKEGTVYDTDQLIKTIESIDFIIYIESFNIILRSVGNAYAFAGFDVGIRSICDII